jgi:CRP-like cAMP-binding protein
MQTAPMLIQTGNLLIDALPENERNLLLSVTKQIVLEPEQPIYEYDDPIRAVYFPINSIFSTCSLMEDGSSAEIALTGHEGIIGISAAFNVQTARNWTSVLIGGKALRLENAVLQDFVSQHEILQHTLLRFYRGLMTQVSQRAVCNGRHTLLQRFCFWLLLVHGRARTNEIQLTHETIARKLGARRAGITNVAGTLQEMGAIAYSRGTIRVLDLKILQREVCECYSAVQSPVV